MNLYLLTYYGPEMVDAANGFVVAANSPSEARQLASEQHGDEGARAWKTLAKCQRLGVSTRRSEKAGVLLRSFHHG